MVCPSLLSACCLIFTLLRTIPTRYIQCRSNPFCRVLGVSIFESFSEECESALPSLLSHAASSYSSSPSAALSVAEEDSMSEEKEGEKEETAQQRKKGRRGNVVDAFLRMA